MYNVLERQSDTLVKRCQVIYLALELKKAKEEIAEITGYTVGTVRKYITQFADLLDQARSMFEETVMVNRKSKYDEVIDCNGYDIRQRLGETCYLFEFYDINHNLVCSKVGTTTRTIRQRIIEEMRSKTYKEMGVTHAKVNRIYTCGEMPAEGLESLIRSEYIKKYPKAFKKNDRFIHEYFNFDTCDYIAKEYLGDTHKGEKIWNILKRY